VYRKKPLVVRLSSTRHCNFERQNDVCIMCTVHRREGKNVLSPTDNVFHLFHRTAGSRKVLLVPTLATALLARHKLLPCVVQPTAGMARPDRPTWVLAPSADPTCRRSCWGRAAASNSPRAVRPHSSSACPRCRSRGKHSRPEFPEIPGISSFPTGSGILFSRPRLIF
jgi:hypothetical protein